jgi:hypothetical protein
MQSIADLNAPDIPLLLVGMIVAGSVFVFGVLIFRQSMRVRANERFEKGLCVRCGYDIRASTARCSECGFPIAPPELPLTMALRRKSLMDDWPATDLEPRKPEPDEDRVDVYTSENTESVKLLADQLKARGIVATLRSSSLWTRSTAYDVVGRECKYLTVSVWSGDVERWIEIIRSFKKIAIGGGDKGQ